MQVHRDFCRHQSPSRRVACRHRHPDPPEDAAAARDEQLRQRFLQKQSQTPQEDVAQRVWPQGKRDPQQVNGQGQDKVAILW